MFHNIQYITAQNGIQTSVIIPMKDWAQLIEELNLLKKEYRYIHPLKKKLSKLSKAEILQRANISEENIKENKYTTIEELENLMKGW